MSYIFQIKMQQASEDVYWFTAKEKYLVRINIKTGKSCCTCMAGTFKESGHKQEDCKHLRMAKDLLKSVNRME